MRLQLRVVKKRLRRPAGKIVGDDEVSPLSLVGNTPSVCVASSPWANSTGRRWRGSFSPTISSGFRPPSPTSTAVVGKTRSAASRSSRPCNSATPPGHSATAVRRQVWTALLLSVLLRVQAFLHDWSHRFTRLCTLSRGVVWGRFHWPDLLVFEGAGRPRWRMRARPDQAFLPGFASQAGGQNAS